MNIRMAAVAACALALGATPAAADLLPAGLFFFETTFTASSNVVQVGETVILDLKIRLVPDLAADAAVNVRVDGMAFPQDLQITDGTVPFNSGGHPHIDQLFLQLNAAAPFPTEYTFAVSYDAPGNYSPAFRSVGELSVHQAGNPGAIHLGYFVFGTTSVSVVPAPVVGAGLPGLMLAFGSGLAWWRRRYPLRVQLVPFQRTSMC